MNARFLIPQILGFAALAIVLLVVALFPDRALDTWLRWLRVVPLISRPGVLRTIAALGFVLFAFLFGVVINAWLYIRSRGH